MQAKEDKKTLTQFYCEVHSLGPGFPEKISCKKILRHFRLTAGKASMKETLPQVDEHVLKQYRVPEVLCNLKSQFNF